MRAYYMLIVFVIVLFSFGSVAGVLFLLQRMNLIRNLSFSTLIALLLVSSIAGGLTTYFIGRRILTPMVKLSNASKEVARGNYQITVSDASKLEEVQTTFRNFNAMVRELNGIATLSNDFVANVSHEFKTPLTAIEGYAMLLQDSTLPPAEREEYLNRILLNTHRLSTLVGNILMLSKIENKSLSEQSIVFRLDEQIRQALLQLEPRWTEKRLELDVELDSVQYTGFEALCMQLWTNLIGNAVKFSPEGGTVRVLLRDRDTRIVVTVADEGEGMSEETQRHIFEKFYQGDTSHRSEGNGLGLALVKRIVAACEGSIAVESAPGEGAVFTLELPKRSES